MNVSELGGRRMKTRRESCVLSRHLVFYFQKTRLFCIPKFSFKTLTPHWGVWLSRKLLSSALFKNFPWEEAYLWPLAVWWAYLMVCFWPTSIFIPFVNGELMSWLKKLNTHYMWRVEGQELRGKCSWCLLKSSLSML